MRRLNLKELFWRLPLFVIVLWAFVMAAVRLLQGESDGAVAYLGLAMGFTAALIAIDVDQRHR